MIHLFLDTDVILDFLGDRKPFSKHAAHLFLGSHQGTFKLYTSSNSITTAYYILCKIISDKQARSLIVNLLEYIHVIPVTDKMLHLALNSEFKDFEDAVQHYSAMSEAKIKCIVTRNLKDYKKSNLRVSSPEEWMA